MCKHYITRILVFLLLISYMSISYAQNITVTGTVVDNLSNDPLIGVTVREKGTANGVITNIDGQYSINVSPKATLTFSYLGFTPQEITLNGRKKIDVFLESTSRQLDELIVIGYGVQKKSDVTGSISSISGKEINHTPVSSTLQALQGRAAGVNIIQNTGAPGSTTTIKIRGTGTINDADPLYVVDGFIVDDINHLNPNDIDNVEIFKDAASSAVYGSRAANGVVAIITKSGKQGKTKVTYDGYIGISNPWKKIKVMGLEDYALMQDYINGTSDYSADGRLYMSKMTDGTYFYDQSKFERLDTIRHNSAGNWWDAITRTGLKMQHGISVSGGSDKTQYLVSTSYYDEQGIIKTSGYKRFNARVNINTLLAKWLNLTANISFTNEKRLTVPEGSGSILKQALYESPMLYLHNNKGYWYSNNPLAVLDRDNDKVHTNRLDMNLGVDIKLCKYLTYQFKTSFYTVHYVDDNFFAVWGLDEDFTMPYSLSSVYKYQSTANKWEVNNLLTFMWSGKRHNLTMLVGQTAEGYKHSYQQSSRYGTPSNESIFHYLSSAYTGDKTYGLDREWTAIGIIGRMNYSYNDTYLLQANIRADGSSKFAKNNRWGIFPSVSLGWKFSNETFMKKIVWLTQGKFRIGWGILGNNRIDELARYTYLTSGYNYAYGLGNHSIWEGSTATVLGNNNIKWI